MDAALKAAKNGDVSESAVDSFILEVGEANEQSKDNNQRGFELC